MFRPRTVQLKETFQHFLFITVVCGVLHLDVLHDGRDSPGLNGGGGVVLLSVLPLPGIDHLHVPQDGLGVAHVQRVLRRQPLAEGRRLEPESPPVVLDLSVVRIVERETLDPEVGVEVAHSAPHLPLTEVAVFNRTLMSVAV